MAYKRPENLGTHGERRVVGILTLTNIIGMFAGLSVMWQLGALLGLAADGLNLTSVLRIGLAVVGGAIGVMATLRWSGISLWDKVMLWGGYQLRRGTGGTLIKPPMATRAASTHSIAPLLRGGKVIAEVYDPNEEQEQGLVVEVSHVE